MKAKLLYQKKPNVLMKKEEAAKITLGELIENYAEILEITVPDGTRPDAVFSMYQDRPVPLPAGIRHSSMSCGDIVQLGHTLHVCCDVGWYSVPFSKLPGTCWTCVSRPVCQVTGDLVTWCKAYAEAS
jgi:hypothetical protein